MLKWSQSENKKWSAKDSLVHLTYEIWQEEPERSEYRVRIDTGTKHEEAKYGSFKEAAAFAEGFSRCYASSTWRR